MEFFRLDFLFAFFNCWPLWLWSFEGSETEAREDDDEDEEEDEEDDADEHEELSSFSAWLQRYSKLNEEDSFLFFSLEEMVDGRNKSRSTEVAVWISTSSLDGFFATDAGACGGFA